MCRSNTPLAKGLLLFRRTVATIRPAARCAAVSCLDLPTDGQREAIHRKHVALCEYRAHGGGQEGQPVDERVQPAVETRTAEGCRTDSHYNVLQPVQRVAQATRQSVEELLVTALQAALHTLEGLPSDVVQHLVALESLDDQALSRVMLETVPLDQQRQLHDLLLRNQAGMLTDSEREQLALLQQQADLVMLRKARAAVLLRFRGKRVPTPSELSPLAAPDK